ncbi:hypothetical protein [uncultured Roseibium sp.]|uniref:hypothetical protein n=1 Tax=uncultured Roseibium sp. TaxID=1936171 RepID=UPI0026268D94|nr:hypothetical protein [uncultured Roseibium sp.]
MDYENKENHFKPRGNLFLEISAIFIFVLLILFAGVVFHFYTEVESLYDDKQELLARISSLENRLGDDRNDSDISRLFKEQQDLREQVSGLAKQVEALTTTDLGHELENIQKRVSELEKRPRAESTKSLPREPVVVEKDARTKLVNDIQISLRSCSEKMLYLYCDVSLKNLGTRGRKIEISNASTHLADLAGNTYSVSAFTLGTDSEEEIRYKASVFVSKARPVSLRFRFFEPTFNTPTYAVVQFNIDGSEVAFESISIE